MFLSGCASIGDSDYGSWDSYRFADISDPIPFLDTGGHRGRINDIVVSNDGRYIVSASNDGTVRVLNSKTLKEIKKIAFIRPDITGGMVYSVALSPDEHDIALGGLLEHGLGETGNNIFIFDFESGELHGLLKSHEDVVNDLIYSKDGRFLVSASADSTVKVWNVVNDYELLHTFKEHRESVNEIAVFTVGDDYYIVSGGSDGRIFIYSLAERRVLKSIRQSGGIRFIALSDSYIAGTEGNEKTINIYDHTLNLLSKINTDSVPAGLEFSNDGKLLLSCFASPPSSCIIYDVENDFQVVSKFNEHNNLTIAGAFADTQKVVTGGGNGFDIYAWNAFNGDVTGYSSGQGNAVWAVATMDNKIAFGSVPMEHVNEKAPLRKVFDMESQEIYNIEDDSLFKRIETVFGDYSLDHSACSDHKGTGSILEIRRSGEVVQSIIRNNSTGLMHYTYGFNKEGLIISGGSDGYLTVYDRKGNEIASLIGHKGDILSLALSGDRLISGSSDKTIKLWDLSALKYSSKGATYELFPEMTIFVTQNNDWLVWNENGLFSASEGGKKYIDFRTSYGPAGISKSIIPFGDIYEEFWLHRFWCGEGMCKR